MSEDSFICSICEETFIKGLTDEEAKKQLKEEFPGWGIEQCDLVCDDCFNVLQKSEEE